MGSWTGCEQLDRPWAVGQAVSSWIGRGQLDRLWAVG
jgi:hypothetical protein